LLTVGAVIGKQAVVVGAGMGGLTCARVLADHFERVVVLERDALPPSAAHRPGTPQSKQVHGLVAGGQRALGDLFSGFERDIERAGAVPLRAGLDVRIEHPVYDPFPQRDLGWTSYAMSRPLLELTTRRHVERYANIVLRQRCWARDFVATPDGRAVTAVRFEKKVDGKSETLHADLVVDASGRGALTLALLKSIGQELPEETAICIDASYATAIFSIPDDAPAGWKGVVTYPQTSDDRRGGRMMPLEGSCWMVGVTGRLGETPPGDVDVFLCYVQQLRTPTIYSAIKRAKRLGEIARFGLAASVRRHFERLKAFPRGLLPIADALCRLDPAYSRGMSVAAQEARLLRRLLVTLAAEPDPLASLATTFFAEVQALIEKPWAIASLDFIFPSVRRQRPSGFEQSVMFVIGLNRLAARDAAVHKLYVEVSSLLKPPSVLRDPELVQRARALIAER
jgi:flavin-dependent dehydrogenase